MSETPSTVFKIFTHEQWAAFTDSGVFEGSDDDQRDGFIHLSTREQMRGSLDKHFSGQQDLVVAEIETAALGNALKFESSSDGQLFPHLYRSLAWSEVMGQSAADAW